MDINIRRIIIKPRLPKVIWDFFVITLGAALIALSYDL